MTATTDTAVRISLRERKKLRTREALMDAAVALFGRKGFEATTVEEIADAVEVSSRTFFRYFASKEDVVASMQARQYSVLYDELKQRPRDEPMMTAIRRASVAAFSQFEDSNCLDASRFTCVAQLAHESPAAFAASMELCTGQQERFVQEVAARMGVDPATDPRPLLVAAVSNAAVQVAVRAWRENEPGTRVSELADRALALVESGLNYPAA